MSLMTKSNDLISQQFYVPWLLESILAVHYNAVAHYSYNHKLQR